MISLWVATSYLLQKGRYRYGSLLTALPASFMTAVSVTYILVSKEGFRISSLIARPIGLGAAIALFVVYLVFLSRRIRGMNEMKPSAVRS
jgi:uncharacterized membrane protein YciS (DUF1049 family)